MLKKQDKTQFLDEILFLVAKSRILRFLLCSNVLKKGEQHDAIGETTIDRIRNTNARLRPEHRVLETVAGA